MNLSSNFKTTNKNHPNKNVIENQSKPNVGHMTAAVSVFGGWKNLAATMNPGA